MKSIVLGSALCASMGFGFTITNPFQTAVANADPQQCIEEKCPNEWAACQKDPKCVPALEDCQKKCKTSTTCWGFCLTKEGDSAATNIAKCASKNGCLGTPQHPFEQCMGKSCSSALSSCMSDDECRADLRHCRNIEKVWDFSF